MKSLYDRGFLFLLSSTQMVDSKGTEKLFVIFSCQLNTYLLPWVKFSLLGQKGFFLFYREMGATGEEPTSIIHLPGVKEGC